MRLWRCVPLDGLCRNFAVGMRRVGHDLDSKASRLKGRQLAILGGFALTLAGLPFLFPSPLAITILNQMGISILFALSYNLLLGQAGILSFGHAVYFGLGGFFAVHLMNGIGAHGWPVPLPLLPFLAGLFGLLFAVVIGSFSTRRAGTVFAMISLGIGELIAACSIIFVVFFGGEEGISADRTLGPPVFGYDFVSEIEVYGLTAAIVFLATTMMYLFAKTPLGSMANAVRDNPERAEFLGYSQRHVRFMSFVASGFFAGVAGGLFAINYEIVTEENLNLATSGWVLLMVYVGGIGYFVGPIIGAVLLTLLQTVLSHHTEIWRLYLGLLFLFTVMFAPNGLTGLLMMHGPAWHSGRLRRLAWPYAKAFPPLLAVLVGVIALLEMIHHVNASGVRTTRWSVFAYDMDLATAWPWLAASALAVIGGLGLQRRLPELQGAWEDAQVMGSGR
jgi:branched-chain amino acid transport system permease protein